MRSFFIFFQPNVTVFVICTHQILRHPSILLQSIDCSVPFFNNIYLYPDGYKSITNLSHFKDYINWKKRQYIKSKREKYGHWFLRKEHLHVEPSKTSKCITTGSSHNEAQHNVNQCLLVCRKGPRTQADDMPAAGWRRITSLCNSKLHLQRRVWWHWQDWELLLSLASQVVHIMLLAMGQLFVFFKNCQFLGEKKKHISASI